MIPTGLADEAVGTEVETCGGDGLARKPSALVLSGSVRKCKQTTI